MAKWNPQSDAVGKNEHVGRRLFDEPMLMGATDQPNWGGLDYRHFEESRGDRQLSLDRLGASGVTKSVVGYLLSRARFSASLFTPSKNFNGWAVVSVKFLEEGLDSKKFPVVASPQGGTGIEANIYHAHSELPIDLDPVSAALHIRQIFVKKGKVVEAESSAESFALINWKKRLVEAIRKVFRAN